MTAPRDLEATIRRALDSEESCYDCGGSGVDDRDLSDCETCNGTGLLYTADANEAHAALSELVAALESAEGRAEQAEAEVASMKHGRELDQLDMENERRIAAMARAERDAAVERARIAGEALERAQQDISNIARNGWDHGTTGRYAMANAAISRIFDALAALENEPKGEQT